MQFPRLTLTSTAALEREIAQLKEENARLLAKADLPWFHDHPVPALIVSVKTGKILEVNEAALKQYRYERRELVDQSLEMLRASLSSSFSRHNLETSLGGKTGWTVKQQRRDGSVFSAEMIVHPIVYQGTSAELVQIWDVSRRVDAELNRRSLERRYNWLMEHATESLWRFELEVPIPVGLPVKEQIDRCYHYGYLAEASASTARLYGYPQPQAMIGMRLESLLPRTPPNEEFLRAFIQNGYQISDAESIELDANGRNLWFINRMMGEVEGGLFTRAWGASLDVTDRRRLEEHQKQSDQLWRDALENVQLLALFLDDTGGITYINPYFTVVTGWQKEDLLGKPMIQSFDKNHPGPAHDCQPLLRGEIQRNHCNSTFKTKSGNILHIHWNNTVILDAKGKPIGVFSIGEDVTEQQRVNEALQNSESRYRRLVEGLPLGIYRSTPSGQLTFCNPVVLQLLGLETMEEASKFDLNQYKYGPSYPRHEFLARMEKEGAVYGLEFKWTKPNGESLWVREHARAIRDVEGKVFCYEGTLEDITREKQAAQSIEEREEHYRMLSELAPIGIFMTCRGTIINANQYLANMLGYDTPLQIVGQTLLDLLHPLERDEVSTNYLNVPDAYGLLPIQERRLLKRDGSSLLVQGHVARVHVNHERGSVIVVRDISEERQAEMERRRWQQRVLEMQKLESLGLLAGGLAHDFNNQLTVILGHAGLLQQKMQGDEALQGLLAPIEQAARHSTDLCQQMLSFAGRGKIQVHQVNLTQLVQNCAGLLKIACAKKAQLHFELEASLPLLQAEEAQLRQVLINLVSNSAESMSPDQAGSIYIKTGLIRIDENYQNTEVTLELPKGEYVYLDVADTGSGMDVNTRRRIFEPFFTTKPTGRGLGLPAVLGIIRSHGGAIEVSSKLRQGTVFRVYLPIRQPTSQEAVAAVVSDAANSRPMILVVDDEASVRNFTCKALINVGWSVLEAADGLTACELMRQNGDQVKLALIDLVMPGMDGVETLRNLWIIQPGLPAMAMSSYGAEELEQRFSGFPVQAFLTKPFTLATLEQAVEQTLGKVPTS